MQLTCHMFLIHLVEDFCAFGFSHLRPVPKMAPLLGCCRDGSRAIGPPLGKSDATNMSHVPHQPSGRFLELVFPA